MDTKIAIIALVAATVIATLVRLEFGVVVALASALWACLRDPLNSVEPDTPPQPPPTRAQERRARRCRAPLPSRQNAVVRQPHTSMAEQLPSAPDEEHFLDVALTRQKLMRGVSNDHTFHTHALPREIAVRAKELPNFDPAIRMLDEPKACTRPLGHI